MVRISWSSSTLSGALLNARRILVTVYLPYDLLRYTENMLKPLEDLSTAQSDILVRNRGGMATNELYVVLKPSYSIEEKQCQPRLLL
jgi:hypothetical protein